jgi:hypothetical protein
VDAAASAQLSSSDAETITLRFVVLQQRKRARE